MTAIPREAIAPRRREAANQFNLNSEPLPETRDFVGQTA
jgi:hypothetical protein